MEFKRFFRQVLANTKIHAVGIESVISKRGLNYHHSAKVLHEIRSQLIDVFYADFGVRPIEVNNWSWKTYALPDGYRSQNEKGSARWFSKEYALYGSADATDSIGIFQYLTRESMYTYPLRCVSPESAYPGTKSKIVYTKVDCGRTFEFNGMYSIFSNAAYFSNRAALSGIARLDFAELSEDDIERYSIKNTEEVYLVVTKT
jgi:hypothetical protein